MTLHPFTIHVPESALQDLRRRLQSIRWPAVIDAAGWQDGTSLAFLRRLTEHWCHRFDWRAQEARLNRLPQFRMTSAEATIHFLHQPGHGPDPLPLVLTHGWPGSFIEMERLIPLLADPGASGGDPADAFHVVVPSLPGYGFSPAPSHPGVGAREIARLWHDLMRALGYERFGAQGGDLGAGVSMWLARQFPGAVRGIHLNYIPASFRPALDDATPLSDAEQDFQSRAAAWALEEGAYAALHATKPQTLAFALADSPVGLAAWIAEKFRSWSDCGGEIERILPLDALLTDISLYWFGGDIAAALRLYKENRQQKLIFAPDERVTPPLGVALFPHELPMPPRSWLARVFDVRRWTHMPAGGHFAALEQPERLAEDIRAFFRPLRAAIRPNGAGG